MPTTVESLEIKTPEQIRDDYLRTYRNVLIRRGIADPNVSDGTEIYGRATALAQQIYAATNNVPVAANAQMADTAQGDDLVRVCAPYKLALRAAGPSAGSFDLAATVSTAVAIPDGAQLIDPAGLSYEVDGGGPFSSGDPVPLVSLDTGEATNLDAGTTLRWVSPPPFVNPIALVSAGGLTGGVDAETYEGLRARLFERLQNPPNGVNWPSVTKAAEDASTSVQKGFAYPACNGPSTMHCAVVRAPTASNKGRDLATGILNGTVKPAVLAAFPEFVEVVVTTVQNYPVSVAFGLTLPASPKASPPGVGGGWSDAEPFPVRASVGYAAPSAVASSTAFTIASDSAPVLGGKVCWVSTDDWVLRVAAITAVSGAGPYDVTIGTPFVSKNGVTIAPGDYVFPHAEKMATYVKAALDGFATLGPGQKTDVGTLLPRAARRPFATQSWLSDLRRPFLRRFSDAGEEVADVDYLYQSAVAPPVPAAITDGPYQIVPARLGFYPL